MTRAPSSRLTQLRRAAVAYATELHWPIYRQHGVTSDGACTCWERDQCRLERRGKHAAGKGWRDEATTDAAVIASWFALVQFNPAMMIPPSVAMIDIDDRQVIGHLAQYGPWPVAPTQRTGRGIGMFFRAPTDGGIWPRLSNIDGLPIETKGVGDTTTLPPSRHWNGTMYTWLPGRHPLRVSLPEVPPRFLLHVRRTASRRARATGKLARVAAQWSADDIVRESVSRFGAASNGRGKALHFATRALERIHADDTLASTVLDRVRDEVRG